MNKNNFIEVYPH